MVTGKHLALVGLGANLEGPLGGPVDYIEAALRRLEADGDIETLARSRLYRSAPWGNPDQDDFVNGVVALSTGLDPRSLLDRLLFIESELGRRRGERWGPRLIDLDLLSFDDLEFEEEGLCLPHPRMHERAFVLFPLLEIDPEFTVPGKGPAADFLDAIGSAQRVEPL